MAGFSASGMQPSLDRISETAGRKKVSKAANCQREGLPQHQRNSWRRRRRWRVQRRRSHLLCGSCSHTNEQFGRLRRCDSSHETTLFAELCVSVKRQTCTDVLRPSVQLCSQGSLPHGTYSFGLSPLLTPPRRWRRAPGCSAAQRATHENRLQKAKPEAPGCCLPHPWLPPFSTGDGLKAKASSTSARSNAYSHTSLARTFDTIICAETKNSPNANTSSQWNVGDKRWRRCPVHARWPCGHRHRTARTVPAVAEVPKLEPAQRFSPPKSTATNVARRGPFTLNHENITIRFTRFQHSRKDLRDSQGSTFCILQGPRSTVVQICRHWAQGLTHNKGDRMTVNGIELMSLKIESSRAAGVVVAGPRAQYKRGFPERDTPRQEGRLDQ